MATTPLATVVWTATSLPATTPAAMLPAQSISTPTVADSLLSGFTVEALAEGVYALVRARPPGFVLDSNVVFIVDDDGVVVVDANLTATSAEASIDALRALTPKPVRYLVNTHRHADHVTGNAVYLREFPGIEIIGHEAMREDLAVHGQETLDGWIGWARQLVQDLPPLITGGKTQAGVPLTAGQTASLEADLIAARTLVSDAARLRVVLPTMTVHDRLTLRRGSRTIEILHPGRGHTRGDLVVWLPGERVLAAGDLIVTPVPLVGGDQSYVSDWIGTLDSILALDPRIIVPGHGKVLHQPGAALLYRDFLEAVDTATRAAMAEGASLEQAIERLDVQAFEEEMAGDDPVLHRLFSAWGPTPAVTAIYRVRGEATGP